MPTSPQHAAQPEGREQLRQLSRRCSPLREGESPATIRPSWLATSTPYAPYQPPRVLRHVLPKVGGFEEEGGRSTARAAQFYRTRIGFALKPSYPNHCGLNCQKCLTRCTLPMVRPFLQLLVLPHPEASTSSQPADICTGSG